MSYYEDLILPGKERDKVSNNFKFCVTFSRVCKAGPDDTYYNTLTSIRDLPGSSENALIFANFHQNLNSLVTAAIVKLAVIFRFQHAKFRIKRRPARLIDSQAQVLKPPKSFGFYFAARAITSFLLLSMLIPKQTFQHSFGIQHSMGVRVEIVKL